MLKFSFKFLKKLMLLSKKNIIHMIPHLLEKIVLKGNHILKKNLTIPIWKETN